MAEERLLPERLDTVRRELEKIGATPKVIQSLVRVGWTTPMIREAKDLTLEHGADFRHVVKLRKMGIPFPVIDELLAARSEHPDLPVVALHRCWQLCMQERTTEDDREFFRQFLDAVDGLCKEAQEFSPSPAVRSPSFLIGRLLEYIEAAGGDLERVFVELKEAPGALLSRILESSERALDHSTQVRRITGGDIAWLFTDDDPADRVDVEEKTEHG